MIHDWEVIYMKNNTMKYQAGEMKADSGWNNHISGNHFLQKERYNDS